jgi:hypothetical protein
MRVIKMFLETGLNVFATTGTKLKLVDVNYQYSQLMGWFLETQTGTKNNYQVYVALTGEILRSEFTYIASAQFTDEAGHFVVHAFD